MKVVEEGLFFHPKGEGAEGILKRMLDGTVNPRLDDPFYPAIHETRQERERLVAQIERAESRLNILRGMLKRLDEKSEAQQAAIDHYAETGEIDPVLVPSCESVAMAEVAEERQKVKAETAFVMPPELETAGWHRKSVHVTENEIVVTIYKVRTDNNVPVAAKAKAVVEKVKKAMQPFQVDGAHLRRVLLDRIATRPQQPKGPPDG